MLRNFIISLMSHRLIFLAVGIISSFHYWATTQSLSHWFKVSNRSTASWLLQGVCVCVDCMYVWKRVSVMSPVCKMNLTSGLVECPESWIWEALFFFKHILYVVRYRTRALTTRVWLTCHWWDKMNASHIPGHITMQNMRQGSYQCTNIRHCVAIPLSSLISAHRGRPAVSDNLDGSLIPLPWFLTTCFTNCSY